MAALQLELPFIHEDPELRVNRALERLEDSAQRNRKSLHAKTGQALKIVYELQEKVERLERELCHGRMELRF